MQLNLKIFIFNWHLPFSVNVMTLQTERVCIVWWVSNAWKDQALPKISLYTGLCFCPFCLCAAISVSFGGWFVCVLQILMEELVQWTIFINKKRLFLLAGYLVHFLPYGLKGLWFCYTLKLILRWGKTSLRLILWKDLVLWPNYFFTLY